LSVELSEQNASAGRYEISVKEIRAAAELTALRQMLFY